MKRLLSTLNCDPSYQNFRAAKFASSCGNTKIIRYIIPYINRCWIITRLLISHNQKSPSIEQYYKLLFNAVQLNEIDLVTMLLLQYPDLVILKSGESLLEIACKHKNLQMVKLLLNVRKTRLKHELKEFKG